MAKLFEKQQQATNSKKLRAQPLTPRSFSWGISGPEEGNEAWRYSTMRMS
jgi:hypothetical protein